MSKLDTSNTHLIIISEFAIIESLPNDICLVSLNFFRSGSILMKYLRPVPAALIGLQYFIRIEPLLKKFNETRQYREIINSAKASFIISETNLYFDFTASAVQSKYRLVSGGKDSLLLTRQ